MKLHRELTADERKNLEDWQQVVAREKSQLAAAKKKLHKLAEIQEKVTSKIKNELRPKATGENLSAAQELAAHEQQLALLGNSIESAEADVRNALDSLKESAGGMRAAIQEICEGWPSAVVEQITDLIAPYFREYARAQQVITHGWCDAVLAVQGYAKNANLPGGEWDEETTAEQIAQQLETVATLLEGGDVIPDIVPQSA